MKNKQFYSEELEKLLVEGQTHLICVFKRFHEPLCSRACEFKDCIICKSVFNIWLNDDHIEKVKISLFEQSILHHLIECGFEYIAREDGGDLYGYVAKPQKSYHCWWDWENDCDESFVDLTLFNDCFTFITGEDTEPTNIYTLLDNCEVIKPYEGKEVPF